jgi:hypothetical protein
LSGREKIGRLIGVGTGPGDPELLTLKAVKALSQADVLAHFAKRGNAGNARAIVEAHARQDWIELPLLYPVTTESTKIDDAYKDQILGFYEESAQAVARHLDAGRTSPSCRRRPAFLRLLHAPACAAGASLSDRESFRASPPCRDAGRRLVCPSCRATTC